MKQVRSARVSVVLILVGAIVASCATNQPIASGGGASSSQSISGSTATDATQPGSAAPAANTSRATVSSPDSTGSPAPATTETAPAAPSSPSLQGTGRQTAATGGTETARNTASQTPSPVPPQPAGGDGTSGASGGGAPRQSSGQSASPAPQPQPLSREQINAGIFGSASSGSWPLASHGQALVVSRRISAGGNPEVFAVFVNVKNASDAAVSKISDFSRLFKQDLSPTEFSLVQFRQEGNRLVRMRSFPLGKYVVFESLRVVAIHKGYDLPFAVATTFQTQEGSNEVWVTFSDRGSSQITLHQTLSRSLIIEDINNDGYLDVIIKERGIEEGTGYETFLTWYKWDGRAYKDYKTTNIVRNLRAFLNRAAELLSADSVEQFFQSSLLAPSLAALRAKGLGNEGVFFDVFHLLPSSPDNPNDPLTSLSSIQRVIFPNIFENPFTEQDVQGYSFPMTVRFVSSDGVSHFYGAKVYMHKNPFVEPQFSFATAHK